MLLFKLRLFVESTEPCDSLLFELITIYQKDWFPLVQDPPSATLYLITNVFIGWPLTCYQLSSSKRDNHCIKSSSLSLSSELFYSFSFSLLRLSLYIDFLSYSEDCSSISSCNYLSISTSPLFDMSYSIMFKSYLFGLIELFNSSLLTYSTSFNLIS